MYRVYYARPAIADVFVTDDINAAFSLFQHLVCAEQMVVVWIEKGGIEIAIYERDGIS